MCKSELSKVLDCINVSVHPDKNIYVSCMPLVVSGKADSFGLVQMTLNFGKISAASPCKVEVSGISVVVLIALKKYI